MRGAVTLARTCRGLAGLAAPLIPHLNTLAKDRHGVTVTSARNPSI